MLLFFPDRFARRFLLSAALMLTGLSCLLSLRFHAGWLTFALAISGLSGTCLLFLYLRRLHISLTDTEISLYSGIFIRQERRIRLRHVYFVRRIHLCGIRLLILHVCGGRLVIPFLCASDLRTICRKLPEEICHAP